MLPKFLYVALLGQFCVAVSPSRPAGPSRLENRRLTGRQYGALNHTTTPQLCSSQAPKTTAPKENVWAPISGPDTAAVISWLAQQAELNLTIPTITGTNGTWHNSV